MPPSRPWLGLEPRPLRHIASLVQELFNRLWLYIQLQKQDLAFRALVALRQQDACLIRISKTD